MQVKSITLHNIGQFKELTIPLAPFNDNAPKVTVFIGNNGSGKTTVLKSLVAALSWLPARIRSERGRGLDIPEEVIMNGQSSGMVVLNVLAHEQEFIWKLSKSKKGKKNQFATDLKMVNDLVDYYRAPLFDDKEINLPAIIFYPVERTVSETDLSISDKKIEQIHAYDNALEARVNFQPFFKWFRNEEDIENEMKNLHNEKWLELVEAKHHILEEKWHLQDDIHQSSKTIRDGIETYIIDLQDTRYEKLYGLEEDINLLDSKIKEISKKMRNSRLDCVRIAIFNFLNFNNIKIERQNLMMIVDKISSTGKFERLNVSQLSQGEKSLMALVGDIARRLAMLNPSLENPLHGQGIVIIDEADLHLHPQWQRQLIARLTKTFPNCQFVLSTHSPLVISDSKDIVVYSLENGEVQQIPSQYGQDVNMVLLNAMETAIRNEEVTQKLNYLLDLIQNNQLDDAKIKLTELRQELPENNLELAKAQLLLKKQEIRHEKNSKNS